MMLLSFLVRLPGVEPAAYCLQISTFLVYSSQKGVDFWGEESVTVAVPREAVGLIPDPALLAMLPLRGFGGDGAESRYHQRIRQCRTAKAPQSPRVPAPRAL
jgi:hypothetical protein